MCDTVVSIPTVHFIFFFNDTATTEIYTLSLHDALPIWPLPQADRRTSSRRAARRPPSAPGALRSRSRPPPASRPPRERSPRSEEHTSELQSRQYLVCRLLLEKKNKQIKFRQHRRKHRP